MSARDFNGFVPGSFQIVKTSKHSITTGLLCVFQVGFVPSLLPFWDRSSLLPNCPWRRFAGICSGDVILVIMHKARSLISANGMTDRAAKSPSHLVSHRGEGGPVLHAKISLHKRDKHKIAITSNIMSIIMRNIANYCPI